MPFTFKASISVGANRVNIEETRKQRKSCFWWEANRARYIVGLSMVRGTDRGQVRFLMTKDQAKTSQSCQSMVGWSTEQMLQKTFDPALASDRHFSLTSLLLEIFPQRPEAFSEYPEKEPLLDCELLGIPRGTSRHGWGKRMMSGLFSSMNYPWVTSWRK